MKRFAVLQLSGCAACEVALLNAERVDRELERAVGRVVHAFDPCIACATH